jgi:peptide/nickel transport system substrate-binding protein
MSSRKHPLSRELTRRQFLALAGAGAGATLLAACQPAAAPTSVPPTVVPGPVSTPVPPTPVPGGVLTLAVTFDPDTLDAPNITSAGVEQIAMVIYDRLVELGTDLKVGPGLAESWTSSPNATVWTFKLRKGAQFHDGTPVDADAVKFNLDRLQDATKQVKRRAYFVKLKSSRVVDSSTIELTTDGPFAPFPYLMATTAASIVSPKAVKELGDDLARKPVGSGPFIFQEWKSGDRVTLKRNPTWWGGAPKLDGIVYRTVPEASTRVVLLETGEVDIAQHLPPSDMKRISGNAQLSLLRVPSLDMRDVRFCMLDKRFADLRVRQAMNYAVNVPEIIDTILAGSATYTGGPMCPSILGAITSDKYKYNPTLAKQLLTEAGYPNGFKATMWGAKGTASSLDEMLQALQSQWKAIGIEVTLDLREVAAFQALATQGPETAESSGKQLLSLGISSRYPDPDAQLYAQYHSSQWSPAGVNRGFYKNTKVDELLDQGAKEIDPTKRTAIYKEVQLILLDDLPGVLLYNNDLIYGMRKNLKNVALLPSQHMPLAAVTKG